MGLFGLDVSNNSYRENLKNENINFELNEQNLSSISEVVNEAINTMRSEVENSQKSSTSVDQSINQTMDLGDIGADGSEVNLSQNAKISFSETTKMLSKVYQRTDMSISEKVVAANAVELAAQQIASNSSQQKNSDTSASSNGQSAYSGCPEGPLIGTSVCNSDIEKNIMNYNESQIQNIVNNSVSNSTVMKTDNAVEALMRVLQVVNVAANMSINQSMKVGSITALNGAKINITQTAEIASKIAKEFENETGVDLKRYLEGSTVSDSYNKLMEGQYTQNDAKQDNEVLHKTEANSNKKLIIIIVGVIIGIMLIAGITTASVYGYRQNKLKKESSNASNKEPKLVGGIVY